MYDLKRTKAFVLDLVFPNRCPLCGMVINWRDEYCQKCFNELPYTGEELCFGCGNTKEGCTCRKNENVFSRCYAAFYYSDSAKGGVVYLKKTINNVFPRLFAEKIKEEIESDQYKFKADLIVPVPMSSLKRRKRGFNQAEVLADSLGKILDIPVYTNVLIKNESFIAQHKLSANSRRINAERLYSYGDDRIIKDKTVIIVDDVMTTGSTVNSCAEILLEMGAAKVIAAVAATTIK